MKKKPIAQRQEPEVVEAIRLINKFFPESKDFVTTQRGIGIWLFVEAMELPDFGADCSCDLFGVPAGPDLGLASKGGFEGDHPTVYARLLAHAGFSPQGRCVIIPDALGEGWSLEGLKPIVCDHKMAAQRIDELNCLFDQTHDSVFVFESGEAMAVDHDTRFFWSKSRRNMFKKVR